MLKKTNKSKKKQRAFAIAGIVSVIAFIGVVFIWNVNTREKESNDNRKNVYQMALISGYSGDIKDWAKSILGKNVIQKNGTWWIGGYDTGVNADSSDAGQEHITVSGCYSGKDGHLWIKLSNDKKIDGGKTDTQIDSVEIEYAVTFLDFDKRVLKKEMVKGGEAAEEPEIPTRKGYKFQSWDKSFEHVTEDLMVTAQYIRNDSPVLWSETVKAKPGDKGIEVPIQIKRNPGILGMEITVSYNEKALKLVEALNGDAFKGVLNFTKGNLLKSGCKFVWDGQEIGKEDIKNGEILVLKFDIPDIAKKGTYFLDISYKGGSIVDNALSPVSIHVKGGEIIIQ